MLAICYCMAIRNDLFLHVYLFVKNPSHWVSRQQQLFAQLRRNYPLGQEANSAQDKLPADSANLYVNALKSPSILVISTFISRFFDISKRARLGFGQRLLATTVATQLSVPPFD